MEKILTTYKVKGKELGLEFLFKYDLKGHLRLFEIITGELNDVQIAWLYNRFPATEEMMKTIWMKNPNYKNKFSVELSPADLSFDTLWSLYGYKESRKEAEKFFNKLNEADKIKCFIQVPKYKKKIAASGIAQAMLSTWINKQRFNDEY